MNVEWILGSFLMNLCRRSQDSCISLCLLLASNYVDIIAWLCQAILPNICMIAEPLNYLLDSESIGPAFGRPSFWVCVNI